MCKYLLIVVMTMSAILSEADFVVETKGVNPSVLEGLEIVIEPDAVLVKPGRCLVEGKEVGVQTAIRLEIDPAPEESVENEKQVLQTVVPKGWFYGTRLLACMAGGGVTAPGCFTPRSASVKGLDGTVFEEGKDFQVDDKWGMLGRTETSTFAADQEVLVNYSYGLMRIDTILISADGKVSLATGEPSWVCPHPPEVSSGYLRLANVFRPYHAQTVQPWHVFVIGPPYPEPTTDEIARRGRLIPKTLEKLTSGEAVHIVAWGDSVTCGGDASTPEKAFPQLFASTLGERFPKATITLTNAGIGGSNTNQRLPNIQEEALSFKPDLVTIEYINDMGLPAEDMKRNYFSAIDQIRAISAEVIIITPHFAFPEWMGHEVARGGETRAAVKVLREIAAEKEVALADTSKRWAYLETEGIPYLTYLFNGINHPDDRGHGLFVKDLMNCFPE